MPIDTILQGDCLEILRTLPDDSVDCVITSPPYWGLRDYGTGNWEGGDLACSHTSERAKGNDRRGYKQETNAGTTALVAQKLNRHYIGIELNAVYIEMANKRLSQKVLL